MEFPAQSPQACFGGLFKQRRQAPFPRSAQRAAVLCGAVEQLANVCWGPPPWGEERAWVGTGRHLFIGQRCSFPSGLKLLRALRILNCTWTPGGYEARFVKSRGLCDSLLAWLVVITKASICSLAPGPTDDLGGHTIQTEPSFILVHFALCQDVKYRVWNIPGAWRMLALWKMKQSAVLYCVGCKPICLKENACVHTQIGEECLPIYCLPWKSNVILVSRILLHLLGPSPVPLRQDCLTSQNPPFLPGSAVTTSLSQCQLLRNN